MVGSNWGQLHHPSWSANLLADPLATVQVGRERQPVRATPLQGAERDRPWERLRDVWPAYDTYRDRSGRELRMFRLDPDASSRL